MESRRHFGGKLVANFIPPVADCGEYAGFNNRLLKQYFSTKNPVEMPR